MGGEGGRGGGRINTKIFLPIYVIRNSLAERHRTPLKSAIYAMVRYKLLMHEKSPLAVWQKFVKTIGTVIIQN